MDSKGRRNPVCKSPRWDAAAARGLCLLCFTTTVLSCWQGRAVVCVADVTLQLKKIEKSPINTYQTSILFSQVPVFEKAQKEIHFTSHVWRLTPLLSAQEEAEGQRVRADGKQVRALHRRSRSNRSCWTFDHEKERVYKLHRSVMWGCLICPHLQRMQMNALGHSRLLCSWVKYRIELVRTASIIGKQS